MHKLSTAILAFALYRGELVRVSMSEEEYWNLVDKQREEEKAQVQRMVDEFNDSIKYQAFVCREEPDDITFMVTGKQVPEARKAAKAVARKTPGRPRPRRRFLLHGIVNRGHGC